MNYAFRLMYLPIGLFGVSIATAALPEIARDTRGDDRPMRRTISAALRMMLMLNVPATLGLIALAQPIVALLLERGQFTPARYRRDRSGADVLRPGLLGYSAVKIASPRFYSLRDSRTPVIVSVVVGPGEPIINLMLVRVMGYEGLALGTALAAIFNAGMLLWLLHRALAGSRPPRGDRGVSRFGVRRCSWAVAASLSRWLDRRAATRYAVLVRFELRVDRSRPRRAGCRRPGCSASRNSTKPRPTCCGVSGPPG